MEDGKHKIIIEAVFLICYLLIKLYKCLICYKKPSRDARFFMCKDWAKRLGKKTGQKDWAKRLGEKTEDGPLSFCPALRNKIENRLFFLSFLSYTNLH